MRREYPEGPVVAVGAVIFDSALEDSGSERVLLVRRGQEPLIGEWSLPGGVVELGESLEAALRREVREETGLEIEPLEVVEVLSSIVREGDSIRYHYVILDYLCAAVGGSLRVASDVTDVRWVSREQLNSHSAYRLTLAAAAVIEKAFEMRSKALSKFTQEGAGH